ncbi:hypothetical protein ILYODFUR_037728 [Ilyodon furcidens]|uniref:Uncharacterized protein n=1 Tax=Ilyodon furcidens TaxID=33524 RepID=A0ABV0TUC7_9TELE
MVLFWNSDCQVFIRETAWGKKLSVAAGFSSQRSVAPPEGKSLNSLCAECVGSAEILAALFLTLELYKIWMEGTSTLMILSADLIVHCSLDLSCFVDETNHTEMDEDRTD